MSHTHACTLCGQPYACDAPLEPNHDGWPSVVCVAQMEPNIEFQMCEGCREHGCCEQCEVAPATGDGYQPFYCASCEATWLDNYDGPDPDYDAVGLNEQCERALQQKRELDR